jgi:hypothetical protein
MRTFIDIYGYRFRVFRGALTMHYVCRRVVKSSQRYSHRQKHQRFLDQPTQRASPLPSCICPLAPFIPHRVRIPPPLRITASKICD